MMDAEREAWIRRVLTAAQNAAEELRKLGDPTAGDLLADLDDFHALLVAELRAAGREI